MEIFEATTFDLDQLSELFNEYRKFYKQQDDLESAKKFLSERIKNKDSVVFVAVDENLLVGFVQLYPLFSSVQMKKLWLLNDLFVQSDYRKKGVATELINQSKSYAIQTGACGIMLETATNNAEANPLYTKEGFNLINNNFYSWFV